MSVDLDTLDIREGLMVEVLTMTNQLTFLGKVERYSSNGILTIQEAKGGELPPVLFNKEIKMRLFWGEKNVVLRGKICGSTRWMWRVDRLESQFTEEKRAFFRQNVDLEAEAKCIKRAENSEEVTAKVHWGKVKPGHCQVLDVSAGGLLIRSRDIFRSGDQLLVSGVVIVSEEMPFTFSCRVRRVREEPGSSLYGCQFEALSQREQDRLLRAIFIAQRREIQNQKERG